MSKNRSITDILAEQRQKLLHAIIQQKQDAEGSSQSEHTTTPFPKRFAIENFLQNCHRKMKAGHARPPH